MYEKKLEEVTFGVNQLHKSCIRSMTEMAEKLKKASGEDDPFEVVRAAAEIVHLRERVITEKTYHRILQQLTAPLQHDETVAQRFASVYRGAVEMLRNQATSGRNASGEDRLEEEYRLRAYGEVVDVFLQVDK